MIKAMEGQSGPYKGKIIVKDKARAIDLKKNQFGGNIS